MMKVLVTGTSGLLGNKIVGMARKYKVYPTHATRPIFPDSIRMDITNESEVRRVFSQVKPDVVIHTAAETNVDRCENEKAHAWKINVDGTRILAEACSRGKARIVYISTDYVFDGEKGLYAEEDKPNPVNHYGITKLMGERHAEELCESSAILRTSVLYGTHPDKPNFAKWVVATLTQGKSVTVVKDHYNSPTLADNLAEVVMETVKRSLEGLYHAAGSERISRYNLALKIAETFKLDTSLIKPIEMSELKAWTAKRPKDSSLRVDKIQKEIGVKLLDVAQGLRELRERWTETE
jgi:dTDP-4-dehydrorhamnose reductase